MATQTITPQYVNMPKPGKSYGSVKLANGNKFVGKPEVLGMMERGKTYEISTQEQTWGDGVVHVIMSATLANGHAHASQQTTQTFERPATPVLDAERMFVAGALNSILPKMFERDNGLLPSKVADTVNMFRQVWSETFGAKHD